MTRCLATVVRVIDGDTVAVHAQPWPGQTQEVAVRLRGVDTPELRKPAEGEAARAARDFVQGLLPAGRTVVLGDPAFGKYAGRVVADVYVDGGNLGPWLAAAGYGRAT